MDWEFTVLTISANPLYFAAIGLLAGAVGALFGLGGGILVIPFLSIIGVPMPMAVPTCVTYIAFSALLTTLRNRGKGNFNLRLGVITALIVLPVVEACTHLMKFCKTHSDLAQMDRLLLGGYMAFLAVTILLLLRHKHDGADSPLARLRWRPLLRLDGGRVFSLWIIGGAAALVGVIAGMLGMGGGQIMVPLFMTVIGMEARKAIGTSSFVIMVSALYGAGTYSYKGMVDFPATGFLASGSILGVLLGTALLSRAPGGKLKNMYVILASVMLLCLILKFFAGQLIPLTLLIAVCTGLVLYAAVKVLRPHTAEV